MGPTPYSISFPSQKDRALPWAVLQLVVATPLPCPRHEIGGSGFSESSCFFLRISVHPYCWQPRAHGLSSHGVESAIVCGNYLSVSKAGVVPYRPYSYYGELWVARFYRSTAVILVSGILAKLASPKAKVSAPVPSRTHL